MADYAPRREGKGQSPLGPSLLDQLDEAPLDARYWVSVGLLATIFVVEFFDLFIVGFLISVVGPEWSLSYGQSAAILMSAGLGTIVGALLFGSIADRFGRKTALVMGILLCGTSGGLIAFIPDGAWHMFMTLRFFVGVGIGGSAAPTVALVVELTPTRLRTLISSALNIPAGAGILLAAMGAATLLPIIGWRGLALLGFAPLILAPLCILILPESARWLLATGQTERARQVAARQLCKEPWELAAAGPIAASAPEGRFLDLLKTPGRFWLIVIAWVGISTAGYGVVLWGPTVIALLLSTTAAHAASLFSTVALSAIAGRMAFSILPQFFGRKISGQVMGFGAAAALAAAAFLANAQLGGVSAFVIAIVVAAFFYDGGCANLAPYAAELYPVRLAARAAGLAAASNGVGRIVGPLCLALIAGADDPVSPAATVQAILPGFLTLAACAAIVGIVFTALGVETHRRSLAVA